MGRLRRFLPSQVADLIIASGTERQLESHRREITALFCDLRGFMGFTERADAEDVMALLREYHAAIGEIIIKYSGTLLRWRGVMVIFNEACREPSAPSRLHGHRNARRHRRVDRLVAPVGARHWLWHRYCARLRHIGDHRLRGPFRLCRHRDGVQCGFSALRRSHAGTNPHQCAGADGGRGRREHRACGRVRAQRYPAAPGGLQCPRRPGRNTVRREPRTKPRRKSRCHFERPPLFEAKKAAQERAALYSGVRRRFKQTQQQCAPAIPQQWSVPAGY
jgi:hypothetical protein